MIRDEAIDFVLRDDIEGGYANNPRDPGGETKYGISRRAHPDEDIKNLTKSRAAEIYRDEYWNNGPGRVVDIAPRLAFIMLDASVNQGSGWASAALQGILHVKQDGIIGPQTLAALQEAIDLHGEDWVVVQFVAQRAVRYASLSSFSTFGFGWMVRLAKVMLASEPHAAVVRSTRLPELLDQMAELVKVARNEVV